MANTRLICVFAALCIASTIGHSYVTSPTTRSNQKQSNSGCRGPLCFGPCDVPLAQARTPAVTIARGASINVQWPRNNHAGGFIRFAWAQTSGSDVHTNFDNNVQEIHCHEVGGCRPDNINDPNGGDSGPADGSSRPCQTTIKVPLHLTDGSWTLQWVWYGGAFALGDYYSCVDYKIAGGPSAEQSPAVFIGGDFSYPGQQKCKYFNTDRPHACVNEPCNKPVYTLYQERSGPAYLGDSTTPTPTPKPATTATPAPATKVTTGKSAPATTGRPVSVPSTTGRKVTVPSTTGARPSSPNSNSVNCAGLTSVVDADFEITVVDTWSDVIRMEVKINVNEAVADWMVQIIWPDDATNTQTNSVVNAGTLQCTATVPTRHSMVAASSWAKGVKAGEELSIEIRATNTNMNNDFIKSNTRFVMFRK